MRTRDVQVGDRVRFARMPGWVKDLPIETQKIFGRALGGVYEVVEFDREGDLVLELKPATRWLYGQIIVCGRYVDPP